MNHGSLALTANRSLAAGAKNPDLRSIASAAEKGAAAYAAEKELVRGDAALLLHRVQELVRTGSDSSTRHAADLHTALDNMIKMHSAVLSDLRPDEVGSDRIPLVAKSPDPYELGELHTALEVLQDAALYVESRIPLASTPAQPRP